jgi:glycosyltransferase involved in cell wall biosynthesis
MENSKIKNSTKMLYFFIYGDQHHKSNEKARRGEKMLSDGGSNIHTNFLLQIKDKFEIMIYTYQDNYQVRNFFSDFSSIEIEEFKTLSGLFNKCLIRIETATRCIYPGLTFLFKKMNYQYLITQTDFLPDTFSAWCAKIRNPKIEWIASFFLRAPAPWDKDSPYRGKNWVIGFFYWLLQKPSIWMIKNKADKVMVTSEPDVTFFVNKKRDRSKIVVAQGGVNIEESEKYLASGNVIPVKKRKYDACFVGRFHYQKGIIELIEIWRRVCDNKQNARLAIIGHGQLEDDVKNRIKKLELENNIDLLGFKDGEEKYEIFKQAKIIVHPATYDSGGMAAAGGMAWGLPGVSFDLESLKTYYPKGMIKAKIGDDGQFAENILKLLNDSIYYNQIAQDAHSLIVETWDWKKRAENILKAIVKQ